MTTTTRFFVNDCQVAVAYHTQKNMKLQSQAATQWLQETEFSIRATLVSVGIVNATISSAVDGWDKTGDNEWTLYHEKSSYPWVNTGSKYGACSSGTYSRNN